MAKVHAVKNQVQHVCMPCMFLNTPLAFESTYYIWNWSSPPPFLFRRGGWMEDISIFPIWLVKSGPKPLVAIAPKLPYFIWLHFTLLAVFTELGYNLCEASSQFWLTPHPASTEVMWCFVIFTKPHPGLWSTVTLHPWSWSLFNNETLFLRKMWNKQGNRSGDITLLGWIWIRKKQWRKLFLGTTKW